MTSELKKIKGELTKVYHCDHCGKKISKKGVMQKTAKHITSNTLPHLDGKDLCRECLKQI